MIEINLLPKDLQKRTGRIALPKSAAYLAAAVGVLLAVLGGLTFFQQWRIAQMDKKIAAARVREAKMQKDIELVDALTGLKAKILERMAAIENLDKNRSAYVRLFEDLASRIPEYLWLSSFREGPGAGPASTAAPGSGVPSAAPGAGSSGTKTSIEGFSYSLNSLANFLIQVKKSPFLSHIELSYAREQKVQSTRLYNFQLTCDLTLAPEQVPPDAEGQKPIRLGENP
jgi:Tfp pilus assembly protein PilN